MSHVASAAGMAICGFFLSRQYVAVPFVLLALAGSIDGLVPKPPGGTLTPFPRSAARTVAVTMATLAVVYTMVLAMGGVVTWNSSRQARADALLLLSAIIVGGYPAECRIPRWLERVRVAACRADRAAIAYTLGTSL